ncbi:MAG: alanine--tRNA ligase [Bacteroidales bacterium]|nr:alanine--tRNA ligase [Bacteroidales bacterium]
MDSEAIRQKFLDFFRSRSHEIVPSASMIIKDDPTLMFTNAGMNQFKEIFLDNAPVRYTRIANTQKCLRVSGKHNDLEEVGHDGYHHTMFEMLGNWSFGDYFKKEAIAWAWDFLVDEMKIPRERLYATVFEGNIGENLEMDRESYSIWEQFLPGDHILTGSKKDNFWEMGDTGPCGPCSEIHVDLRTDDESVRMKGSELVNTGDPRVIEIWNLVFIQYNRRTDGGLSLLPKKHIDTGMGFERLCMVVQQKCSNYDTDLFQPIIREISDITGIGYGISEVSDTAMRVIADHIRAISFAIADGLLPSNTKAGYVIRRILRRAVRYSFSFLGQKRPILYKLVEAFISTLGKSFPELSAQNQLIERVVYEEELSFLRTLESGVRLLDQIVAEAGEKQKGMISGKAAFELYDTYGFPLDLTELMLKEQGMEINHQEFDQEMEKQRERSKSASSVESGDWMIVRDERGVEDFVGYDQTSTHVKINRYRKVTARKKQVYHIVFNVTPFYAESGGQIGDTGYIDDGREKIRILDTFKEHGLIIHVVEKLPEDLSGTFTALVNDELRWDTAKNHTATHLLHHALRSVLGKHVEQKGSLVSPDYLRFDFSHFQKLTDEEMNRVEMMVNHMIRSGIERHEMRSVPVEKAREMGAMALFGEKYGDKVRVIQFGDSVELCGGIHVESTSQIGMFKIISEGSVAAGIRRIEAVTGRKAEEYYRELENKFRRIEDLLNKPQDVVRAVSNIIHEKALLERQMGDFIKIQVESFKKQLTQNLEKHGEVNIITGNLENSVVDAGIIRDVAYQMRKETDNLFLVIGAVIGNKPHLAVMISDNLVKDRNLNAGEIIRTAAREFKGEGGGQSFFATAGGKEPDKIDKAIRKAVEFVFAAKGKKDSEQ